MRRTNIARGDEGFTILELVVSLGLLALMTAFMVEGISLVRQGNTLLERVEQEDADRTVEAHLRRTLERAVPVFEENSENTRSILFSGEPDRLSFISRADGRLEAGGLVRVDVRTEDSGDGLRLVTERRPFRTGLATNDPVHLLVDDIAGIRLRYYGQPAPDADFAWSPRWTSTAALPRLVELTVTRSDGRRRLWPALVFALPAATATTN